MKEFHLTVFNEGYDSEVKVLRDSEGNILLSGDYYHDKIDSQLEGFFSCLDYLGVEYKIEETFMESDDPYSEM